MSTNHSRRLEQFLSLTWYENALRFIVTFIAKTSELLLAGGLVVSTANFLTDGHILSNANAAAAWAWVQALALDSSLGISFYYVLQCLKLRDWVKFALYLLLTGLLTLVAGSITDVDIFSHAIHTSMSNALAQLGFDVGLLSTLRAIAVVGFVLLSRLKDVSFKDLYHGSDAESVAPTPAPALPDSPSVVPVNKTVPPTLTIEEAALLFHALLPYIGGASSTEPYVKPTHSQWSSEQRQAQHTELAQSSIEPPPSAPVPVPSDESATNRQEAPRTTPSIAAAHFMDPEPREPSSGAGDGPGLAREERLEGAYRELIMEGKKVSARALAERAHVHRSTCAMWLEGRTGKPTPLPVPDSIRPTEERHSSGSQDPAPGDDPSLRDERTSLGDSTVTSIPGDNAGQQQGSMGIEIAQEGQ